jgi:hypothetical protein
VTADDVLDSARDYHASFTRGTIPDKAALRALSRYQRRLAEKVASQGDDALAVPVLIEQADVADALVSGEGIPLPAHLRVMRTINTWHANPLAEVPVTAVAFDQWSDRGSAHHPAVSIYGGRLYPLSLSSLVPNSRTGWEDFAGGLRLIIVPLPVELTALDDALTLPDVAQDALVTNLALWMAGRTSAAVRDLPLLPQHALDAEAMAVDALASQDSANLWVVRDL